MVILYGPSAPSEDHVPIDRQGQGPGMCSYVLGVTAGWGAGGCLREEGLTARSKTWSG
jgi:hypothetical protein